VSAPPDRRRALDRRLLRLGRPVAGFVALATALGIAGAAATVATAVLLGFLLAAGFGGATVAEMRPALVGLLAVFGLRAALAWAVESAAFRSAAAVKTELRRSLALSVLSRHGAGADPGRLSAAAGAGIEALDPYFSRYLPQVVLAAVVPVMVLVVMAVLDPWSAVIIAATLPLIPIFAVLVGEATRQRVRRRWEAFSSLSSGFLESLRALPTLKVFGRSGDAVARFRRLAEAHRRETMGTLRVAFLSALVLELAATISVAVVAVAVGLRVLGTGMELQPALTVLILAPEAYAPLRRLAAEFHTAAEGVEAAGRILDEIERPAPPAPSGILEAPHRPALTLERVRLTHPGAGAPTLDGVDLHIPFGEYLAVVGPTGTGKSTLLEVLLGLDRPGSGAVLIDGVPLDEYDRESWWQRVAWLPQRPHLLAAAIDENVRFGRPDATDDEVAAALRAAGASFVWDLPRGIGSPLGEGGGGLSAGERSRIALARALLRGAPILLLDEPTAHLDPVTEMRILDTLDRLRGSHTVLVASHRGAVAARADRVLRLQDGRLAPERHR